MRKIVVMTMIEGTKLSAIETLNKYCERDEELKEAVTCRGGVIIYPVHKPFNERFYNEDKCEWEGNPGIPYELVGQIFKEFGAKQSDHILYPGFDFARTRRAEFIKPAEEWLKKYKDKDQLFAFENMKSFAEHGLVVLEFSSLIDRTVFGRHDQYTVGIIFGSSRCYVYEQDYEAKASKRLADHIHKTRKLPNITIGTLPTIHLADLPSSNTSEDINKMFIESEMIDFFVEQIKKDEEHKDMKDWDIKKIEKAMEIKCRFVLMLTERGMGYIKHKVAEDIIETKPDNLLLTFCVKVEREEYDEVRKILLEAPSLLESLKALATDYVSKMILRNINHKKYIQNIVYYEF